MATHWLCKNLPEDLVERISKDAHRVRMNDVIHELDAKTHDIEFIFRRLMFHVAPILLPITYIKTATRIKEALADFEIYINAWYNMQTIMMRIDDRQYLILHKESIGEHGFLVDVRYDGQNKVAVLGRLQVWGWTAEKVDEHVKNIFQEILGVDVAVNREGLMGFIGSTDYMVDLLDIFQRFQFRPFSCPDYVHLVV